MRTQLRNLSPFYYATFSAKTAVEKDGRKTGEYTITYNDAVRKCANISAAKGSAEPQLFGVDVKYNKTIVTTENLPIDETTALWLDFDANAYDTTTTYSAGDYVFHSGKIYKCLASTTGTWDSTKWSEVPHNYSVVGVAKSLNSLTLAVRKLN